MIDRRHLLGMATAGVVTVGAAAWHLGQHNRRQTYLEAFADSDVYLAPDMPVQNNRNYPEFQFGAFSIRPFAEFSLTAVVLGRKDYSSGKEARLSPVDLALGWGVMSNPVNIEAIKVTQSGRFYFWTMPAASPLSIRDVIRASSNMHMIPAGRGPERELSTLLRGDIVTIEGLLVDIKGDDGFTWKSSRRRDDTGNGACEIVLVKSATRK